jgi:hypothetical protein
VTGRWRISMSSRKELIKAVGARYRGAESSDKMKILDEFVAITGYHHKHAIRGLGTATSEQQQRPVRNRLYDEAVRQALVVLSEASDRNYPTQHPRPDVYRLARPTPGLLRSRHGGALRVGKTDGDFVHTLVLTDIATGWTECVAMPVRNQSVLVGSLMHAADDLPFAMLGIDTDNTARS